MTPAVYQWAARHGVSMQALHELQAIFGMHGGHDLPPAVKGTSEAAVQAAVRLEAARKGVRLFRNNVGALIDSRGVPVRYGLANESKQVNEVLALGCHLQVWGIFESPSSVDSIGSWAQWQQYFLTSGNHLMADFVGKAIRFTSQR